MRFKPSRKETRLLGLRQSEQVTAKERRQIQQGVRPELLAGQRRIDRMMQERKSAFEKRFRLLEQKEYRQFWTANRTFEDYDKLFKRTLRMPLLEFLERAGKKFGNRLSIMEEGAGEGNFLAEAKRKLAEKGINAETTAVSIFGTPELVKKRKKGMVDRLVLAQMERFVPKEKYHLIIGICGAVEYAQWEGYAEGIDRKKLLKELLLKYANSLEKNGTALIGMQWNEILLGRKTQNWRFLKGIESSFEKKGFKFQANFWRTEASLPDTALMIERIR
jgi:hypothetical protein